jgi:excinuclease ABC subunit C
VSIRVPARGVPARWVALAQENAELALRQRAGSRSRHRDRLRGVAELMDLADAPACIECYDVSHTMGEATTAACVVFGQEGPIKSAWRRYRITGIEPGDDYAAMRQTLERRFRRHADAGQPAPDLIVIDGGRGQVGVAMDVLSGLGLPGIPVVGLVKGMDRRAGHDGLLIGRAQRALRPPPGHAGMLLLQEIRDEAHRFAITGHRKARQHRQSASPLERIPGIGATRRRALLRHFGGMQGILRAGTDDLANVSGINKNLARRIYAELHGDR